MYSRSQLWVSPLQLEEGRRGPWRRLRQKGWSTSSSAERGGRAEGGEILQSVVKVGLGRGVEIWGLAVNLSGNERERSDQIAKILYIWIFIGER